MNEEQLRELGRLTMAELKNAVNQAMGTAVRGSDKSLEAATRAANAAGAGVIVDLLKVVEKEVTNEITGALRAAVVVAHDAGIIPDVDASDMTTNELSALLLEQLGAARSEVTELRRQVEEANAARALAENRATWADDRAEAVAGRVVDLVRPLKAHAAGPFDECYPDPLINWAREAHRLIRALPPAEVIAPAWSAQVQPATGVLTVEALQAASDAFDVGVGAGKTLSPEDLAAGAPIEEPCIDCPFKVGGINTTPENATELVKLATSTDPHPCHRTILGPLLLPCRGARQFCENLAGTKQHDGVYKTIEDFTAAKTLGVEVPK